MTAPAIRGLDAGRLNRQVSILERSETRDDAGGLSASWNEAAIAWAAIDIQQSSLIYETSVFVSKVVYRITMRYRPDVVIDASRRIQYTDLQAGITHTYEIKAALNTGAANRELVLMCYELGGQE